VTHPEILAVVAKAIKANASDPDAVRVLADRLVRYVSDYYGVEDVEDDASAVPEHERSST